MPSKKRTVVRIKPSDRARKISVGVVKDRLQLIRVGDIVNCHRDINKTKGERGISIE